MARTTTKKKTTNGKAKGPAKKKTTTKKATTKKAKDPVDELEEGLDEDLQNEFDFDEAEGEDESMTGKWVKFKDGGKTAYGLVVEHEDDKLSIETVDEMVDGKSSDATVVDRDDVPANFLFDEEDEESDSEDAVSEDAEEEEDETEAEEEAEEEDSEDEEEAEAEEAEEEDSEDEEEAPVANDSDPEAPVQKYLPISKIKIPKSKPRSYDPENPSKKYRTVKADIKRRGQREAIKIRSFTNPELVEGLKRLTIMTELGFENILCQEDDQVEDAQDRLFNGLLDNEMREGMALLDLGRTFATLVKGGKYTQKKIARGLGMSESEVSKIMALVKLPKTTREVMAEAAGEDSDYSKGVFLELTSAPKAVQKQVTEHMEKGEKVTVADVRTLKKAAAKAEKGDKPARAKPEDKGSKGITYKRLSSADTGKAIKATVRGEELELTLSIPWKRKTFKGFELIEQVKLLFDEAFSDEETSVESFAALAKALTAAKSELS